MTKDDDFKRIVRRRARERGERYSEAKARLQEGSFHGEQDRWVILRTVPGLEDAAVRWFLPRGAFGVVEALVPRFKKRKFAPGALLVRVGQDTDLATLSSQLWVTGFVGADTPEVLTWEAVRRVLGTEAHWPPSAYRQEPAPPGLTDPPFPTPSLPSMKRWPGLIAAELERNQVPLRPGTSIEDPEERLEDVAAFDTMATAARAEQALRSAEVLGYDRQLLLVQLELGMRARQHLLEAYRYLPEAIVAEHKEADRPTAQLMEAATAGLDEAISSFSRETYNPSAHPKWKTVAFLVMATRTIRGALTTLTTDRAG